MNQSCSLTVPDPSRVITAGPHHIALTAERSPFLRPRKAVGSRLELGPGLAPESHVDKKTDSKTYRLLGLVRARCVW